MTLDLVLTTKWYEMIQSGEKREEYRAMTDYWRGRIWAKAAVIDRVRFHRGYSSTTMTFEVTAIRTGYGNPTWGAKDGQLYYVIALGEKVAEDGGVPRIVQHWDENDRILFLLDDKSCVELDIYKEERTFGSRHTGRCCLHNLWVDPRERRRGLARMLMETAEAYAKERGVEDILLEWCEDDTPRAIRDWYERRGYVVIDDCAAASLMRKIL